MTRLGLARVYRQMPNEQALWEDVAAEAAATSESLDERLALAVQRLAGGDVAALDALWDLCAGDLYGLALWRSGSVADAEDAVQEVFLRLARSPRTLVGARRPRAYLLAMAHHAAVDASRKRREDVLEPDLLLVVEGPTADPARRADAERASHLVRELPPKQRAVVYLKHFAGLTFKDIGRVTGVPTFTASSRYRAAMRQLRERMGVAP
jgi:RNA polymerase sigma-70 factor (ECF subfamily)